MSMARAEDSPVADDHLRIALVNIRCVYSDLADEQMKQAALQQNIERHHYFIERAAARGAEFIGFPELSLNGFRFSENMAWLSLEGAEVAAIAEKAKEKGVYVSVGLAEQDGDGKRWNMQIIIGPDGRIIGRQCKTWLTLEAAFVEHGQTFEPVEVKGAKVGIAICADGTDYQNLKALVDNGAQIIYGPHCNSTGSTTAGWYKFRARWAGQWDGTYAMYTTSNDGVPATMPSGGWIDQLDVYAVLHNHAGRYSGVFDPPSASGNAERWASGAWIIGPDGQTLAQMPTSTDPADSVEYLLIHDIPLPAAGDAAGSDRP